MGEPGYGDLQVRRASREGTRLESKTFVDRMPARPPECGIFPVVDARR